MHLAVDIGNTNIVFGIYDRSWIKVVRLETKSVSKLYISNLFSDSFFEELSDINQITLSSVVPEVTNSVVNSIKELIAEPIFIINTEIYGKLDVEILNAQEIGTDLVCNAVSAIQHYGANCIIVDFGTAMTFTVIQEKRIIGVNILPGIKTSLSALVADAAQLQNIPLELTDSVIGKDTKTAIQSGILWGYVGLVERMLERIEIETNTSFNKVATGGLSLVLPPLEGTFDFIDRHLTLEGIRLIGELKGRIERV